MRMCPVGMDNLRAASSISFRFVENRSNSVEASMLKKLRLDVM